MGGFGRTGGLFGSGGGLLCSSLSLFLCLDSVCERVTGGNAHGGNEETFSFSFFSFSLSFFDNSFGPASSASSPGAAVSLGSS